MLSFLSNSKAKKRPILYTTLIRNLGGTKIPLILYCWLFYDLTTTFFTNLQFVYWRTPHLISHTFLRFERPFFRQLTNYLHSQTRTKKWQLKKGMTIPLKNQCMSCPISMVSVLTHAGGYKLFSGLLYWSMISVSCGWMLCTIHKLFYCLLSFLDSIISNVGRELCWSM